MTLVDDELPAVFYYLITIRSEGHSIELGSPSDCVGQNTLLWVFGNMGFWAAVVMMAGLLADGADSWDLVRGSDS